MLAASAWPKISVNFFTYFPWYCKNYCRYIKYLYRYRFCRKNYNRLPSFIHLFRLLWKLW